MEVRYLRGMLMCDAFLAEVAVLLNLLDGAAENAESMGNLLNPISDRDWRLYLFPINEEFPVSMGHKFKLIKPLPIEHTVPREYRSGGLVRSFDRHGRNGSWTL